MAILGPRLCGLRYPVFSSCQEHTPKMDSDKRTNL